MAEKRKVLLLDGHSLAYRAFFALPPTLSTTGGQLTNAVYGFTSMLLKVLSEESPDAVVVAFDGPRSELRRTVEYPEYKAHRPTMPDELREQMGMIEQLLQKMAIPAVRETGYEADDLLGAMARRIADSGGEAVIVTGDKDTLQLVAPRVRVLMTTKGISETVSYDREAVLERYGVPPDRMPDIVGLKGDPSDNIPGVAGIGEKGAVSLIKEYGSLEGLYEHLEDIGGAKRKQSLTDCRDMAFLSRDLATIDTEAPVNIAMDAVRFGEWDRQQVIDYLCALEFKTLAARFLESFGGEVPEAAAGLAVAYTMVDTADAAAMESLARDALSQGRIGVASTLDGVGFCDVELRRLALATSDRVMVLDRDEAGSTGFSTAAELLASEAVGKSFHDAKCAMLAIGKLGMEVHGLDFDTAVAAYLENPSLGTYHLWDVWERNLGGAVEIEGVAQVTEEQPSLLDSDDASSELAAEAARVFHLTPALRDKLSSLGMETLFDELEMPLVSTLAQMETAGVALDAAVPRALGAEAGVELASLEREIFDLAGHEFKIGSTRQLSSVLFDELKLPTIKKTKTGYSTDSSVLEALREEHPIAGKIIEYREYSKLKSTYFDVLPELICPDTGRLHCSFNQTTTATGRISSSNPNLQNIPVRTEVGRRIREAFVAGGGGWRLLVADYSQIELRVLAHMSADSLLLEAFAADQDVHAETAEKIFGVPHGEVTPEMRRMAKVVNFGVVYGMGSYGLSSRLGISIEEATRYIDTYFATYAGVSEYRDLCIREAAERGYAETLLGRRRFIPELKSPHRQTRELGERLAINTPLQGTAADIIKKAMIEIAGAMSGGGVRSRMTLQIHDELIFEVAPDEEELMTRLVEERMSGAVPLAVPLKVDLGSYDNWGQAKG
ncbi:MAG: DNA polymerase I [Actinobacteria bacterium]|nr:DNA polymerase I [Actinomycetota bacterium]MBU1944702.1 DNA polymerase I [Actinomycetota bacterium]MBU2689250.1 DNA polymerase I [Actinomycetota bacterium]